MLQSEDPERLGIIEGSRGGNNNSLRRNRRDFMSSLWTGGDENMSYRLGWGERGEY